MSSNFFGSAKKTLTHFPPPLSFPPAFSTHLLHVCNKNKTNINFPAIVFSACKDAEPNRSFDATCAVVGVGGKNHREVQVVLDPKRVIIHCVPQVTRASVWLVNGGVLENPLGNQSPGGGCCIVVWLVRLNTYYRGLKWRMFEKRDRNGGLEQMHCYCG